MNDVRIGMGESGSKGMYAGRDFSEGEVVIGLRAGPGIALRGSDTAK